MPYIRKDRRLDISQGAVMNEPGEMNYRLTLVMLEELENVYAKATMLFSQWMARAGISYTTFNTIAGVVMLAQIEHSRRMGPNKRLDALHEVSRAFGDFVKNIVNPYEDRKIIENGDVYPVNADVVPAVLDPSSPDYIPSEPTQ